MSGVDRVLERVEDDPAFRDALVADPVRALAGYDLEAGDIDVLAAALGLPSEEADASPHSRRRGSSSALVDLLTQVLDRGGSGRGGHGGSTDTPGPAPNGGGAGPGC